MGLFGSSDKKSEIDSIINRIEQKKCSIEAEKGNLARAKIQLADARK